MATASNAGTWNKYPQLTACSSFNPSGQRRGPKVWPSFPGSYLMHSGIIAPMNPGLNSSPSGAFVPQMPALPDPLLQPHTVAALSLSLMTQREAAATENTLHSSNLHHLHFHV